MAFQDFDTSELNQDGVGAPFQRAFGQIKTMLQELYAGGGGGGADSAYDNTISGLTATTLKGAIDELSAKIDAINAVLS